MEHHMAPQLIAVVQTQGQKWSVPGRLVIGLLLLFPVGGGIQHVLTFFAATDASNGIAFHGGLLLRGGEIAVGGCFVLGALLRAAAVPALLIFLLRSFANFANSYPWLGGAISAVVVPHGDWAFGAIYVGSITLLLDLLCVGSGRWSIDFWLSKRLRVHAEPQASS